MYWWLLFLLLGKRGFIVLLCAILLRSREIIDLEASESSTDTDFKFSSEENSGFNGKCYVFTINNPGSIKKLEGIEEHANLGAFLNDKLISNKQTYIYKHTHDTVLPWFCCVIMRDFRYQIRYVVLRER